MLQRTLGKTGWQVSVIGFGSMAIGGHYGGDADHDTAMRTVRAALDHGVNLFDTADMYGTPPGLSEQYLGQALAPVRDRVFIATKVGNFARPEGHALTYAHPLHVELCCDASLHRLGTDYIDLYQCHLNRLTEPEVFLEAFDRLIAKGKIRAFGISANSLPVIEGFNRDGELHACQLDYSLLHRAPETEVLPYLRDHNIGTLIRGALDKGIATGKFTAETVFDDDDRRGWNAGHLRDLYLRKLEVVEALRFLEADDQTPAQAALRFVISHPAVTCTIPGARTEAQAAANARAGSRTLSEEQLDRVREVTAPALTWG